MLYLGLPITAAGVLCTAADQPERRMEPKVDCPPRNGTIPARPPAVPPLSERLKQLEDLHARGAISDTEYSAQRLHIIASM